MARLKKNRLEPKRAAELPSRRGPIVWSSPEVEEQLRVVEALLQVMRSPRDIRRALVAKFGPVTRIRTDLLIKRTWARWAVEDKDAQPHAKSAQARRLSQYLERAKGVQNQDGTWLVKPDWKATAMFESLYADVRGTRAPVEINVDARVSQSLQAIMTLMTPEKTQELLQAARQRKELAERATRLLPPGLQ
jgi:hypothetical protein